VLVAGLESENAKERLDVAKLVLAELAEGQKRAERCICHSGKPGEYCNATSPHDYIREPGSMQIGLDDIMEVAAESRMFSQLGALDVDVEKQMLERLRRRANRQVEAGAEAIVPTPTPVKENCSLGGSGYPPAPATNDEPT
jgi:hypothetical protein